jgi:hypothetical protein
MVSRASPCGVHPASGAIPWLAYPALSARTANGSRSFGKGWGIRPPRSTNQTNSHDRRVKRASLHCHKASHAMTDENDLRGVEAKRPGDRRPTKVADRSRGVLDAMGKGKITRRAPGAAIVKVKDIPSRATNVLREIEVALIAGKTVQ